MIRSLVARLTLLEQLTVIAAVLAFGAMALVVTAQVLRSERRAMVRATAGRVAEGFDDELTEDRDTLTAARGVVQDEMGAGVDVEIRDAGGRLLASSRPVRGGSGTRRRTTPEHVTAPLVATARSGTGAQITVVARDPGERATLSALGRSLLIAAVPILILSLLLGRGIATRALRPLSRMAERAGSLSIERNPRSLEARSGLSEVDQLATAFDRLLERLDDALQAERRLTADASHELRTPLTALSGELEMLLERAPVESAEATGLRRAADQIAAMRALVDAILLLHQSGQMGAERSRAFEVVNLGDLSREAVADTRARHSNRDADVHVEVPDEVLVEGHAPLLASAARNLIDNALKFTRPGDRVDVVVAETADQVMLCVDDQGPGVREEERERIFDPFYRGAEPRAGTSGFGLGLPILRRVARAHGGEVSVTRSSLGGARFVLRLPRFRTARTTG